jgi:hypothetical protein
MTAATQAPARPRPARAATAAPLTVARLLRIELRRNAMPWILPLIAVLFWFDTYRPSTAQPPLWALRTFWNMGQGHTIVDFGPLVAGVAAWIGSRDGRRGAADLIGATARPRWASQLAAWAATAVWAVGGYLAFVGVLFGIYLAQGVQGTPPWWWVAAGATAVTAFSAAGFAAGAFFPSRFAAPVAAFGAVLALMLSSQTGFSNQTGWAQILPTNSNGNFEAVSGVFYRWLPDLQIARVMFLAGLAVVALGLLGLPPGAGGRGLRRAAAVVTLAGLAASGAAVGLAATARLSPQGLAIPALHDAANGRRIPYTPVCGHAGGTPVCLHPAYRRYLPAVAAALRPVFAEVAGLPGAPVRAAQVPGTYSGMEGEANQPMTINGRPPVLGVPLDTLNLLGSGGFTARPVSGAQFAGQLRVMFVHAFVGAGGGAGTPAQQAVQAAMLASAGVPFAAQPRLEGMVATGPWAPPGQAVHAAAQRLAAQPASVRHAWLAAHLPALRSGQLPLADLP